MAIFWARMFLSGAFFMAVSMFYVLAEKSVLEKPKLAQFIAVVIVLLILEISVSALGLIWTISL
jgi:hypothetical protein